MSVILAFQSKDKIYLAADNLIIDRDGNIVSDDKRKIIVVNKYVAIAFAGNAACQELFQKFINEFSNKELFVEDILINLKTMFISFKNDKEREYVKNILNSSAYFIIAGKSKENKGCIYSVSFVNGSLKTIKTEAILFPPLDLELQTCDNIYVRNMKIFPHEFIKRTVKDIAELSKVVSHSGDIWTYTIQTGNGTIEHFT
jgi:hypothetical protein